MTQKLKAALRAPKILTAPPDYTKALGSGLSLVNLALTGRLSAAFLPGHYYLFVGDSRAGKTWLLKQLLAEASTNPLFAKYRLIDDNPERGALMDVRRYFGKKLVDRLEPPSERGHSRFLEEFYDNVAVVAADGKPFIYGLDSEDALPPEAELKKARANRRARKQQAAGADVKTKGDYGTGKAKLNSSSLRIAHNSLEDTGSILVVIKQSRDNIDMWAPEKKTRSGGHALTFYAACECWFSVGGNIRRKVGPTSEIIGTRLKIRIKKNRTSGRDRTVVIPFYPDVGFDETGSLVEYLIDRGRWQANKEGTRVAAPEFKYDGTVEKLVQKVEAEGLEKQLRLLVSETWDDVEEQCKVTRKPRYE